MMFDRIGAERLRAVITEFYRRVFDDLMIGFMFAGKDRQHLIDREYEMAARMLGADIAYTGRPMRTAHAAHRIMGGHFERRLQIMREVMRDLGVDPEVGAAWIAHQQALRPQITRDRGSECNDSTVGTAPALTVAPPPSDPERIVKLGRRGSSG